MNENLYEAKKVDPKRQFSREMTACSTDSDGTVVAPAEHSQPLEHTKLLSQTSVGRFLSQIFINLNPKSFQMNRPHRRKAENRILSDYVLLVWNSWLIRKCQCLTS